MVKEELNSLIMKAMKEHDEVAKSTLRAIKTSIMNWETAAENVGKEYNSDVELKILQKLSYQYKDTAEECNDGKHQDLVDNALACAKYLENFLPAPVSEKDIEEIIQKLLDDGVEPIKKNTRIFMDKVKSIYPFGDNRMIAKVIQSKLS